MSDNQQSLKPSTRGTSSAIPAWKQVYLNVHREKTTDGLTHAVFAAEAAIFERLRQLSGSSDHADERAEMQAATEEMLVIKTEKLGWPKPE